MLSLIHILAEGGVLADLAPTMLDLLGLAQPGEMTGHLARLCKTQKVEHGRSQVSQNAALSQDVYKRQQQLFSKFFVFIFLGVRVVDAYTISVCVSFLSLAFYRQTNLCPR